MFSIKLCIDENSVSWRPFATEDSAYIVLHINNAVKAHTKIYRYKTEPIYFSLLSILFGEIEPVYLHNRKEVKYFTRNRTVIFFSGCQ